MGPPPLNILLTFILLFIFTLSLILLKVNHPLSIAYLLLGTAVLSGRMVFKVRISWLFYTLVLVFLGGVIVIIMYITSLAANEKIIYYNKLSYLGLLLFVGGLSSI